MDKFDLYVTPLSDGGPAFPTTKPLDSWDDPNRGMTLRDYFAAKAMQGILSDANAIDEATGNKFSIPDDAELIATASYMMADAMLKQRNK